METSDLIKSIKIVVSEASGIPNFGAKLGAALKANPTPQGGATFGGGSGDSGPTAGSGAPWGTTINNAGRWAAGVAQKAVGQEPTWGLGSQKTNMSHLQQSAPETQKTSPIHRTVSKIGSSENTNSQQSSGISANAGRQSSEKSQGNITSTNNLPKTGGGIGSNAGRESSASSMAQAARYMSATNSYNKAMNATNVARGSVGKFGPSDATKSAGSTKPQQSSTSSIKTKALPKLASQQKTVSRKAPEPRTTNKSPSIKKPIIAKKSTGKWGFGAGSGAQDAGSITNRALGAVNEQTLIETIKKLVKNKNSKCDKKNNGDNPKGAPEGFELNPEINSSIQNR